MPNNATRRAARRANIAAAKAARNAAGVNMFTPLNGSVPVVRVKSVEPGSSPLGANAAYYTAPLRAANLFKGKAFSGELPSAESRQMQMAGLPVKVPVHLGSDQAAVDAIYAENAKDALDSKTLSSVNTRDDTNIRQQMSELNITSTKSLPQAERSAAISSYRGDILGRVGPRLYVSPSNEYEVVNAERMPRYTPSQANLEWLNEQEQNSGLIPPKYRLTAGNKRWLRDKEKKMGVSGAGSHGGRSRKQRRKMRKSRNKY
jgi:hypothetical protein